MLENICYSWWQSPIWWVSSTKISEASFSIFDILFLAWFHFYDYVIEAYDMCIECFTIWSMWIFSSHLTRSLEAKLFVLLFSYHSCNLFIVAWENKEAAKFFLTRVDFFSIIIFGFFFKKHTKIKLYTQMYNSPNFKKHTTLLCIM